MIKYIVKHYDDLLIALGEHFLLVLLTMLFSLILASVLVILSVHVNKVGELLISIFSVIYAIPSPALFALFIPITGLGKTTAIIILVVYNQYILLRNFLDGINQVDAGILEAATGIGMTKMQILLKVQLPLAKNTILAGISLGLVATVSISTIAAMINAGGLGRILFDGLQTLNHNKIICGSVLAALLAVFFDRLTKKFK